MSTLLSDNNLIRLIEWKRTEMMESASKTGILSSQTIKKSTELDQLLNLQQHLASQSLNHSNKNE